MQLRTRIASAILLTTTACLAMVVGAFLFEEHHQREEHLRGELVSQAQGLGINLRGALAFDDAESATATLQSLSAYPLIVQAGVYRTDGSLLASYAAAGVQVYPAPLAEGFDEAGDSLSLYHPVEFDGDRFGFIHLRASLADIQREMRNRILTALLILSLGTLFSVFAAVLIQRQVTDPITRLIEAMAGIARNKDYTVRVPVERTDEMGALVRVFNEMLGEVSRRDEILEITVREQTASISRDNKFIQQVLEAVPAILIVINLEDLKIRSVSRKYFDTTGQTEKPATLHGVATHLRLSKAFLDRLLSGEEIHGELLPCDIEDRSYIFETTFFPIEDTGEYLLELEDITARIAFQNELLSAKRRVETTLGSLTDAVVSADIHGRITYLNPVAERTLGTSLSQAAGQQSHDVIATYDLQDDQPLDDPIEFYLKNDKQHPVLTRRQRAADKERSERVVECITSGLEGGGGKREGVVLVMRDVTEVRDLIDKISHQATHDALTGLLNRDEFQRRLRFATSTAVSDETEHALMYLDLDKFKVVNDTSGHAAGDMLLAQLTGRMREAVRHGDTVARLGGDEFGILMLDCPQHKAQEVAEKIRQIVHEFRFQWEKENFQVGVSIGLVSITPETAKHESVLSLADSACYAAKQGGRNRIYVYDAEDREFADRFGQVLWANRIARSLETDNFFLEAQRITPLGGDGERLDHYEVLIRMRGEDGKPVPPGLFLSAAENYGLMHDLDAWVVRRVLKWCRDHLSAGESIRKLAINLSGHSITNLEFHKRIRQDIIDSGIPGDRLCFEFTETAAISNFEAARKFIDDIGELGCTFSIDDFGTGMSSFAYLKNFPVHYLKIDGVFIRNIVENHIDQAMVSSINDVGHALKMRTIAEFVENDEIVDVLRDIGIDFAQGYGIHKPSPLESLLEDDNDLATG